MRWIMSAGGPLVCVEKALEHSWGGVDGLTVSHPSAASDYERTWVTNDYLKVVPLERSAALAMGEGPMYTFVWRSPSGILFIVQTFYAEADTDERDKLAHLDESIFDDPNQVVEWHPSSSPLVLFDAAIPGDNSDKASLSFDVRPGRYLIQTQVYKPDAETSLLLHRFKPID